MQEPQSEPVPVQVFELTMDNDEDQDALNLRLRKPGEKAAAPPTNGEPEALARAAIRQADHRPHGASQG